MRARCCSFPTIAICCGRRPTASISFRTAACGNSTAIWTITWNWLFATRLAKTEAEKQDGASDKPDKPLDRKEQKRLEAEERQRLSALKKPLEKRIGWLETEIGKLNDRKTAIDRQLADSAIYEQANKDKLRQLLADQVECTKRLAACEEEWLEKQDELEKVLAS